MTKKFFAVIIAFLTIIFTSSFVLAENNDSAGGEWTDSVDKTENTMRNIGNGVESAISGVVDFGQNAVNDVTNSNIMGDNNSANYDTSGIFGNGGSDNGANMGNDSNNGATTGNGSNGTMMGTNNGGNYSAVRTATDAGSTNLFGLSNTAWTWIIMIIAAAVIVSLIYYYGSQFENRTGTNNNNNE